jgi:hypothetical protein
MKIQLLTRMASPEGNYPSGLVLEMTAEQAKPLVDGGYATIVEAGEINANDKPIPAENRAVLGRKQRSK